MICVVNGKITLSEVCFVFEQKTKCFISEGESCLENERVCPSTATCEDGVCNVKGMSLKIQCTSNLLHFFSWITDGETCTDTGAKCQDGTECIGGNCGSNCPCNESAGEECQGAECKFIGLHCLIQLLQ